MGQIYDIRCNLEEQPIAVETPDLHFTFKISDETAKNTGKARVIVYEGDTEVPAASAEKTGRGICSLDCELPKLKSFTRYTYGITVWDPEGKEIAKSERHSFESGFADCQKPDTFIRADYEKETTSEAPAFLFRRDFTLKELPVSAKVFVTAKGLYEFRLNGRKVGCDHLTPGFTSYHSRLQYQTYDVTEYLENGENTAGMILGDGWYKGYINWDEVRNFYGDHRAAWMYLRAVYADGRIETLTADEKFTWTLAPIEFSEIYQGESYDARKEYEGWDTPTFSGKEIFRPVLVETDCTDKLIPEENTSVRTVRELPAVRIFTTPKGEVMVDFGQDIVGNVRLTVEGSAGARVAFRHGEWIDDDGNFYYDNIAPSRQLVEYTLRGSGVETYTPRFTYQNFRYIQILEFPGTPQCSNFTAEVWSNFDREDGFFECSNQDVNRLFENTKWSQRGNFIDVPIAGPQRTERLGWTGDGQIFAKTACFHMDARRFYRKWLGDLRADQFENGAVPWVVPNVLREPEYTCLDFFTPYQENPTSAAWGDAALIIPYELYLQYGDRNILRQQYESMKAYVEYMRKSEGGDYIFREGFHYGDWFALDAGEGTFVGATPKDLIATAFYAYSTSILAKIAALLEKDEDHTYYKTLCEGIKNAFRREHVREDGTLIAETQTACVLALAFGLLTKEQETHAAAQLAGLVRARNTHISTGFVGTGYILHVLAEHGYPEIAYQLLLNTDCPSWLYEVRRGATTIWEHWDGVKEDGSFWEPWMNSFNHYAYGCVGDFLYTKVVGIVPDETDGGYGHFTIRPYITDRLQFAEASVNTVHGHVFSRWERGEDGKVTITCEVPFGTCATLDAAGLPKQELEAGRYQFSLQ